MQNTCLSTRCECRGIPKFKFWFFFGTAFGGDVTCINYPSPDCTSSPFCSDWTPKHISFFFFFFLPLFLCDKASKKISSFLFLPFFSLPQSINKLPSPPLSFPRRFDIRKRSWERSLGLLNPLLLWSFSTHMYAHPHYPSPRPSNVQKSLWVMHKPKTISGGTLVTHLKCKILVNKYESLIPK